MGLQLSVVVVAYDMARELPRTLRTLSPANQTGLDAGDYEVIVVDNGSPVPVDPALADTFGGHVRIVRIDDASPSPAAAANEGVRQAGGDLIGLIVDGARLASPGLLAGALRANALAPSTVVDRAGLAPWPGPAHEGRRGGLRPDRGRPAARDRGVGRGRLPALRGVVLRRVVVARDLRTDGREQLPLPRRVDVARAGRPRRGVRAARWRAGEPRPVLPGLLDARRPARRTAG